MHAKEAWNDQGDILLGSANIDRWALRTNFECCLRIQNQDLACQLARALQADTIYCQTVQEKEAYWLPRLRLGKRPFCDEERITKKARLTKTTKTIHYTPFVKMETAILY